MWLWKPTLWSFSSAIVDIQKRSFRMCTLGSKIRRIWIMLQIFSDPRYARCKLFLKYQKQRTQHFGARAFIITYWQGIILRTLCVRLLRILPSLRVGKHSYIFCACLFLNPTLALRNWFQRVFREILHGLLCALSKKNNVPLWKIEVSRAQNSICTHQNSYLIVMKPIFYQLQQKTCGAGGTFTNW